MPRTYTATGWQAEAAGPAHTTHAGRLAVPVAIRLGECIVAVVDLVLDGHGADQLHAALAAHLSGHAVAAGSAR